MALDPANLARLLVEREVEAGNPGPERGIDRRHARTRIRGAADDLLLAILGIDRTDAQPVGIGMRLGGLHLGDGEFGKLRARILDLFNLEAGLDHRRQNVVQRRLGRQIVLQP